MTETKTVGNFKRDFGSMARNEMDNQKEIEFLKDENEKLREVLKKCSTTRDVGENSLADQVMEIIGAALSGDCEKYLNYDLHGNKYCKWGIVERDIRAILINSKTSPSVESDGMQQGVRDELEC